MLLLRHFVFLFSNKKFRVWYAWSLVTKHSVIPAKDSGKFSNRNAVWNALALNSRLWHGPKFKNDFLWKRKKILACCCYRCCIHANKIIIYWEKDEGDICKWCYCVDKAIFKLIMTVTFIVHSHIKIAKMLQCWKKEY